MNLARIAARIAASQELLATNRSSWSWEYDRVDVLAEVFADTASGRLKLVITDTHTKSGLGAGTRTTTDEYNLGTLAKPRLGAVRSILKKHGMERTSAGSPFKSKWTTPDGKLGGLGAIIKAAQAEMMGSDPESLKQKILEKIERMNPRQLEKLYSMV